MLTGTVRIYVHVHSVSNLISAVCDILQESRLLINIHLIGYLEISNSP